MKEDQRSEEQNKIIKTLIDGISEAKKINNIEKFNEIMKSLYLKAKTNNLSIIHRYTILFYSFYNHIIPKSKKEDIKKLKDLANYMIKNLSIKNISPYLQNEINQHFSNDFKSYEIFKNKENSRDENEICFSICLLSKNINLMESFFSDFLQVTIFEAEEFKSISLENPVAAKLFDSLFNDIYHLIKNGQNDNLKTIIENCFKDSELSLTRLFRCNKCYDFLLMKIDEGDNFKIKCLNCKNKFRLYKSEEFQYNYKCVECDQKIILYKQNYKCTKCKKFLCSKCLNKHCDNCLSLRFIKLYEVGYRCEIHNNNFIYYCTFCHKSLCKFCKDIHPHKIENIKDIYLTTKDLYDSLEILKGKYKNQIDSIKYRLSYSYINDRNYNQFNGRVYEILCEILKIGLKKKKEEVLFNKFNDKEFQNYYSALLYDVLQGNTYSLNSLDSIKSSYTKNNIIELKINYNMIIIRQRYFINFIDECKLIWNSLINIHDKINIDNMFKSLRTDNNNLKIKVEELETKLLINNNSNKIYRENTHNLLCRFLADQLIVLLVTKYSEKFDAISLNLGIFIDLISHSDYNILSDNKIIKTILGISSNLNKDLEDLKESKNESVKEKLKNQIPKYLSPFNQIYFIDDINKGEDIFKKEELNQILDIFYFIKNKGNITAHPNIDLEKSLKMNNIPSLPLKFEIDYFYNSSLKEKIEQSINKNIEKIEDIYKDDIPTLIKESEDDEDIYYKLNKYNKKIKEKYPLLKNIKDYRNGVMDDIINKISQIRDDVLSRFNICKIKKDVQIKDILETIFNDNDNKMVEEIMEFQKVFISETDNVIKKYINVDLEKKLSEENNNFNKLTKILEKIHLILERFIGLNIPRHENLEIYINKILNDSEFDYSLFQIEINNFENKLLKSFDMDLNYDNDEILIKLDKENDEIKTELDCESNGIIMEIYFLLMIKTYEKEKQLLKEIKKKYEADFIEMLIKEEIEQKLNEIKQMFEKEFVNNSNELTQSFNKNFFSENKANKIIYERLNNILTKIFDFNISLEEVKNSKMNIDSRLYFLQKSWTKEI